GSGPIARYANVRVQPGTAAFDFGPAPTTDAASPGVVRAWAVSQAFVPPREAPAAVPAADVLGAFTRLATEPGGLLELHRHVALPRGSRAAAAVARLRVKAASAGARAFDLGFSDRATVFLNGRPLFSGEASYSFDNPRREGLIEPAQARVWLPLAAGDNELAVFVSDTFGGWGLMGRFPEPAGLEMDAR
ncbi:MAG TPA: hypothetical protein VFO85_04845, partial [Vicinamibacteria bacterium]|nr:hypothetical protein [Vicinamibacteria bacterium]